MMDATEKYVYDLIHRTRVGKLVWTGSVDKVNPWAECVDGMKRYLLYRPASAGGTWGPPSPCSLYHHTTRKRRWLFFTWMEEKRDGRVDIPEVEKLLDLLYRLHREHKFMP